MVSFVLNVLLSYSSYCFPYFLPYENCLFLSSLKTQMHAQFPLGKKADQSFCVRKEALGLMLMSIMPMIRCYIIGNVQMCSKAFYFSKVGLGYIGNSAISL